MPNWDDTIARRQNGEASGFIGANESHEDYERRAAREAEDLEAAVAGAPSELWTKTQLREFAADAGVPVDDRMTKAELLAAIFDA